MAEYTFSVLTTRTSLKEQCIYIDFSLDLDEDTVNSGKIYLINDDSKKIEPLNAIVDGRTLQLKLLDWATPNSSYTLIIESGIKSIVDNELNESILKNIIFKSEVTSDINILSPYNYQVYRDKINISWNEIAPDSRVNNYYLEISDDTGFYNIITKTVLSLSDSTSESTDDTYLYKASITQPKEYKLYYIRMRAQNASEDYGNWSNVVTFEYAEPLPKATPEKIEDKKIIYMGEATLDTLPPLKKAYLNFVYTITEAFTTTSDFIKEGEKITIGSNVIVIETKSGDIKYNILTGAEEDNTDTETDTDESTDGSTDSSETDSSDTPTIEIEDLTGTGKIPVVVANEDVEVTYDSILDILPDKYFSIYYPVNIDISNAEISIVRRDI